MLGRRVGSWILERELGRGGMGAVFEARHVSLNTQAAVKVLSPGLESGEAFRQRFRREAELQAQLRHPNVARVLDYVEDGGQWFLVLEYLDRGSLADLLMRGENVSRPQAVAWARQALAGLEHAHRKGIVHRDIKPANLMFGSGGEIVVVDFGIARAEVNPGLTATGITIGTPQYMSPEQIVTPSRVDGRADIYSLGIVLYELLAGRRPFDSGSDFALLQAQVSEPPPPLRAIDPSIPPQLEAVVMRALAKKPEDRYADCAAMIQALELAADAPVPDRTVAMAPVVAMPGTIQQSRLFERAPAMDATGPSPSAVRDRKRRAFQRWLMTGMAAVFVVATLLAIDQTGWTMGKGNAAKEGTASTVDTASTTTTTTSATTSATTTDSPIHTISHQDPEAPYRPPGGGSQVTPPVDPTHGQPAPDPGAFTKLGLVSAPQENGPPPIVAPPAPRPTMPPLPENPQIAVIGTGGDPMLAAALEQDIERRFSSYHLSDEHGDADVDELLSRKGADVTPKALGAQLLKSGFHILILLRVEDGDRRTFHLQGQEGSAKTARVRMNAYLLPANRSIGPGWTELLEYTELSANVKARMAFIGATADLRQAIDDDWKQLRAASAAR